MDTSATTPTTTAPTTTPRIVVGVDASEPSKQALRWARLLAQQEGAVIDAVAVYGLPPDYGLSGVLPEGTEGAAEQALAEAVDDVFGAERPAGLQLRVLEGDAANRLLQASRGALMAVVGSRGHGGFSGLLLGSVSAKLAELAACPVLVVHGTAPALAATS